MKIIALASFYSVNVVTRELKMASVACTAEGQPSSREPILAWPHTPSRTREEGGLEDGSSLEDGTPPTLPPLETTRLRENEGAGLRPREAPGAPPRTGLAYTPVWGAPSRSDRSTASRPRGSGPRGGVCFINAMLRHSSTAYIRE